MKIAWIADCHLGNHRRHGGASERSLNARCFATLAALRGAYERAEAAGATTMVVLGDLLDGDRPEPQLLADALAIIKGSPLDSILIAGNHEMTSDEPGDNSLAPFATVCRVVDTPEVITLASGRVELVLVPHAASAPAAERITCALAALPPAVRGRARLLGIHAGIADEKTAAFLQGSRGSIEATVLLKLMIEYHINYSFAGDWHDRRQWPGILQIGALCPTGWDNPGFEGYGGVAIWDDAAEERVTIQSVAGPRFVRVDGPAELREMLKHPRMANAPHRDNLAIYVSAHLPRDEVATGSRLLEVAKENGTVTSFEVLTTGAEEAREQAHKAAGIARSATTLDEALASYIANAPLDLPDELTKDRVLAKCQEFLR
jgi:hypothetical protein